MLLQVAYEAHPLVQIKTDDRGHVLQLLEAAGHEVDAFLVSRLDVPGAQLTRQPVFEHDLLLRVARRRRVLRTQGRDYVKCWPGRLRQACPQSKGSEHNARLTIMLPRGGLEPPHGRDDR